MDSFQSLILYIHTGSAQNGHISNSDHFYFTFTSQEFLHKFACRLRLKPMLVLLIKVRYCMLNTVSFIWNTHAADVSVQVEKKSASHVTNINNTVVVAVRISIKIPWWQISKKKKKWVPRKAEQTQSAKHHHSLKTTLTRCPQTSRYPWIPNAKGSIQSAIYTNQESLFFLTSGWFFSFFSLFVVSGKCLYSVQPLRKQF